MDMKMKANSIAKQLEDDPHAYRYLSKRGFETPFMYYYRDFKEKNGVEPSIEQTKNYVKTCLDGSEGQIRNCEKYLINRSYVEKEMCEMSLHLNEDDNKIISAWGLSPKGITDLIYFFTHEFENMSELGWDETSII
tara:strand:+ start:148 stop:555 length:408 start_codon:yes stop_codon:yes gene_type:complete